jgi:hypothetical protein
VINWATDIIDSIGLIGVALLVALENVFPPIPSELILLLAGFNVSEGRFDYVSGVIAATVRDQAPVNQASEVRYLPKQHKEIGHLARLQMAVDLSQ